MMKEEEEEEEEEKHHLTSSSTPAPEARINTFAHYSTGPCVLMCKCKICKDFYYANGFDFSRKRTKSLEDQNLV